VSESITGPVSPALRVEAPLRNDRQGADSRRKRQPSAVTEEMAAETGADEDPHALDTEG